MPTYTQPVSFSAQSLIAPDVVVQQQQNERQQQLAAALRNMSFEPIEANGGNIAWTQGMAKIAQALAGRVVQNRADKQAVTLNQAMMNRINGSKLYGYNDPSPSAGTPAPTPSPISLPSAGTGLPPTVRQVPAGPPTQLGGATSQVDPLAALPDTSSQAGPSQPPPPAAPQSAPQPPMPQQGDPTPPMSSAGAPQPRGAFHSGPLTLTGDPDRDRMLSVMYPEEFGKGIVTNAAPVEMARTVQQAQEAMSRGDIATATALLGKIQHDNNIPLESTRPGGLALDRMTNTWHYTPKLGDGQTPTLDSNGNVTGVSMLHGATDAMRATATAEAGGKAAYTPAQVLGPDNNYHTVPLTGVPGFGGGTSAAPGGPALSPGTVGAYYANRGGSAGSAGSAPGGASPANTGNISAPGPQAQTASTTAGKNSANGYQQAIDAGQHASDAMRSLDLIMQNAKGLSTGTGAGTLSQAKSGFNAIADGTGVSSLLNPVLAPFGKQVGFDRDKIAKFDEIKKQVSQLANQVSSGPGSTGTDARLSNAINALPSTGYSPAAIQEVSLNLKAQAARQRDFGIAAAQDMQLNGAGSYANFASQWQQAYNPDIYYQRQKGPAAYQQWYQSMSPTAQARVLEQYRALKSLGAFQ